MRLVTNTFISPCSLPLPQPLICMNLIGSLLHIKMQCQHCRNSMGLTTAPRVQVQYPPLYENQWFRNLPWYQFVCEGESCVCVRGCLRVRVCFWVCAKLHCMQVASKKKKMIVLRHSLCPIMTLVGESWKCNNDDVQSFCVYKRALWKGRESTALSVLCLIALSVLLFCVIKKGKNMFEE